MPTNNGNKRSRSSRKKKVISKEIARCNLVQDPATDRLSQSFNTSSYSDKSRQNHKQSSKSYNYKHHKKHHKKKKKKNQSYSISAKHIPSSKSQKRKESDKLCTSIKTALTTQQYEQFRLVNRKMTETFYTHKHSIDLNRFQSIVLRPYVGLFNTNKRRHFLPKLMVLIPQFYQSFYNRQVKKIIKQRGAYVLDDIQCTSCKDWKCTNCTIENTSGNECYLCGTQRQSSQESNAATQPSDDPEFHNTVNTQPHNAYLEEVMDIHVSADPNAMTQMTHKKVITVNGCGLKRLDAYYAQRLLKNLEALRQKIKDKYKIHQLHGVCSAPVLSELSECAPITMEQLQCFEIGPPRRVDKYAVQIVHEIKCFLHENSLVSPFLNAARRGKNGNVRTRKCVHCRNLFDRNVIRRHEEECVMKGMVRHEEKCITISSSEDEETIDDDEVTQEDVKQVDEGITNDVNMNEMEKEVEVGEDVDYFDGIDDVVFSQMIENEENKEKEEAEEHDEEMKDVVDELDLDETWFTDDDALLQCLLKTEDTIKMKKNTQKELKQKKLELSGIQTEENQIKQRKLKIQQDICALKQRLSSFK